MRQIIQEQDEQRRKRETTTRQQKMGVISLDVRNEASLKPKKARSGALSSTIFLTCCSTRFSGLWVRNLYLRMYTK